MKTSKIKRHLAHANWPLLCCTFFICAIGLINLYSASSVRTESGYFLKPFFERQVIWCLIGFLAMSIIASINYNILKSISFPLLLLSIFLLLLVPVVGVSINNAKRWLSFIVFNFQPSELAKLSVLIAAATLLSRYKKALSFSEVLAVAGVCSIPCVLIVIQPDLGTTLNLLLLLGSMIVYHGIRIRVFISILLSIPMVAYVSWFFLKDYQKERILTFIDPSQATSKALHQIKQSKIAIGSGEMWGNTFMGGTQSKLRFLPESHTDFAIAVFCEEWGFVGAIILLIFFCIFLFCIASTALKSKDRFGNLLCAGVFFYFFWQFLINIGMVTALLPVVGIPLPFISYGGTTTLINFIMLGIVVSVSIHKYMFKT